MANLSALMTSKSQEWSTPQSFFDAIDARYGFTLDACALPHNAKCPDYFTPEDDALTQRWEGVVWCNPPYSHGIGRWVQKAYDESRHGALVVLLIPARTETSWWHDYAMQASEIVLIRGRMRFSGSPINAPFPSALVIFDPSRLSDAPVFTTMDRILDESAVLA